MFEKYDALKVEEKVKKRWEEEGIYDKVKNIRSKGKKFYFLDGPPYATGFIHMGTTLNKVLKDAYLRFFRMLGFNVWDQPGYDTHGTPIEVKVEKMLGFHNKKDIEKYGTEKFIKKCREFATQHIDDMNQQFMNLGVWMDFDNPYITLDNEYIEGAWYTFKVAYDKGLLYKGNYPVHVCPRCQTAVAYNEIEYMKKRDPSIYVKFKLEGEEKYLVIWTTTPWTLPANVAIMVNPNFDYVEVFVKEKGETYIVAKERMKEFLKKLGVKGEVKREFKGEELEGKRYEHPFKDKIPALQNIKKGHMVILSARFVSLEEGTGLVHVAPGHGKEDYQASLPYKLDMVAPLNLDGTYKEGMGELEGKTTEEANKIVLEWLKNKEALLKQEEVEHDYPKCWRCSTPLILMAVPQWFFRISSIKEKLLEENEKVEWQPAWAKNRFKAWLQGLEDWPISRQRYWGIPLPIWECEKCGHIEVIGSIEELKEKAGIKGIEDVHRPYIDEVKWKCEKCGGEMRRIEDVLDVWFDSGVAGWASLGYPKNKEKFNELWPSDLQMEGADQIRGWWNSQMITSVITFDERPFKRIILHGLVLDAKGVKMSKSKGNVISPEEAIERYGRDALRLYLLSSPPWNNFYFNWNELEKVHRLLGTYWNIYQYVKTYANLSQSSKSMEEMEKHIAEKGKLEDRWIIARLQEVIDSKKHVEGLNLHKYLTNLQDFILHDFSRDYIKMVRQRVKKDEELVKEVLYYVLYHLNTLLAIACPYITDKIHSELYSNGKEESVHMLLLPTPNQKLQSKEAIETMNIIKEIIETANRERHNKKIKIRWPVKEIIVYGDEKVRNIVKENEDLLKRLLNTKTIKTSQDQEQVEGEGFSKGKVWVSDEEDEEIKEERFIKEVIRNIQMHRKTKGKRVGERVGVVIICDGYSKDVVEKHKEEIEENTDSKIKIEKEGEGERKVEYKDLKIDITI